MTSSHEDLQTKLAELNQQIAELGGEADAAFAQAGGEADGAQDREDVAAELTNAEENEALLEALYARRERLQQQLKG